MAGPLEVRAVMAPRVMMLATVTLALMATIAAGAVNTYTLNIAAGNTAPDGVSRIAALVNNQFPGTLITGNKGG